MKFRGTRTLARWIVASRYALLATAIGLVIASLMVPKQVDFDRKVTNLISDDSTVLESFRRLKRSFGGNEIVLAVYEDAQLLHDDGHGIRRLAVVSERLEAVDGVRSTLSLDKLDTPIIPIYSPTNVTARRMRALFEGYTHNAAGNIAVVVCMLEPESESTPPRRETIDAIRQVVQELPDELGPGILTGEPVMLVDGYRFVEQDGHRLSLWSSILLGVTILLCFRSVRWMLICVAVVHLSLLLTRVTMALLGMRMSMVSSMLTAVVTVVGVATVVHLIVRFRAAQRCGKRPLAAMMQATRILLLPIFWACITDAVGFAALKSASVGPVGEFGVMMGISCLAVLLSVWLLVPALATIPLGTKRRAEPSHERNEERVRVMLHHFANFVERHERGLAIATVSVVVISLWGLRFLEVETDFTRNFRRGAPIVQAYHFVENNLGGAGVGDILIPAPESLTWEFLRTVRRFEDRITNESTQGGPLAGMTKVLSLADAVLVVRPKLNVNSKSSLFSESWTHLGLGVMRHRIPTFYAALHAEDPEAKGAFYLRIMFRAREQQTAMQKRALISRIHELAAEYFPDQERPVEVTGFYVLLTHLIDNIVGDQYTTFAYAVAGIGLTMILAFRKLQLALFALVPNALPVLVVSGLMGWMKAVGLFEFRINMGSAMIAAVSLGLSIDSSIHYIFAFQRARRLGQSNTEAIRSAHGTVGMSMIFATLALIVGFSVLATSNFTPTVYFGSLVSLAMLGGLLGNLVVLPILLRLGSRDSAGRSAAPD